MLENSQHPTSVFTTLTYDEEHKPPTLQKRDVQLWLKRLRDRLSRSATTPTSVRFFASGEYGETTHRPHYHAILFGVGELHAPLIQAAWPLGYAKTDSITPARIAYCAGYTAKKWGVRIDPHERVDRDTGEVYTYQPPFVQMSRRPGIGGHARQWPNSWRNYAVNNGYKMPVPRFYHEAWKAQATPQEKQQLQEERLRHIQATLAETFAHIEAAENIAEAKHALQREKRKY